MLKSVLPFSLIVYAKNTWCIIKNWRISAQRKVLQNSRGTKHNKFIISTGIRMSRD